ncbi:MAG: universal stress protein [Desulfurivibrionaceae bacterium]|jgi:nucleotide-binding universal stress UspA family protein|nr:universal stress protein [Pseudomonadota bacterium]MCG2822927.1 universal stress protein [Desulfobulbaceae bacterium]MDP2002388.1 universal stress protein [Desulfurivibrionaceae bacterium]MBU4407597.1 universal stress protein [Pseudomonadota bacterium]MBU4412630.1 universal stress protein [Pseudomonadota bacterium]
MAKYRKILVAYDGSPSARNALSLASQLAREDKSWVKVLAVVPPYQGDLELIGVSDIKEAIAGPGQEMLAEARNLADREGISILTNLEQGEPYEQIVQIAEEENCDLIIMGRRGKNKMERELMGSVTARVIGHTGKDVLVTPETGKLSWENILLATDGSTCCDNALARALEIAQERKVKLNAVSVVYTNDEFYAVGQEVMKELYLGADKVLDKVRKWGGDLGVQTELFVRDGEPHQAITALAAEISATLIIMGSHGRKGLTRFLMGSVTERVIGYADCPVLICHLS